MVDKLPRCFFLRWLYNFNIFNLFFFFFFSRRFFFFLPFSFLQIGLAIKCCGEGHVVQGVGNTIRALVWLHALDAVFGLVGWQLATELIRQDVRFVASQNAERINHLRWEGKWQESLKSIDMDGEKRENVLWYEIRWKPVRPCPSRWTLAS